MYNLRRNFRFSKRLYCFALFRQINVEDRKVQNHNLFPKHDNDKKKKEK